MNSSNVYYNNANVICTLKTYDQIKDDALPAINSEWKIASRIFFDLSIRSMNFILVFGCMVHGWWYSSTAQVPMANHL